MPCSVGGSVQGSAAHRVSSGKGGAEEGGLGRINWLWDHHRGLCPFRSPHGPEMCRPGGAECDNGQPLRHQTPALITAVAMALMRLCFVWHAVPTAQQLRMLCRLSCSMQPGRASTAVLCCAVRCSARQAAGHAEVQRCAVVSFAKRSCFTEFAQHCASQHVCCLNHLFPDRSGQARRKQRGQVRSSRNGMALCAPRKRRAE